jgi:hypothetical protein
MMKKLAVLLLLACELTVGGCGTTVTSASNAATVTSGLWGAILTGGSAQASGAVLGFITNFTVNGDGSLSITQFTFNTDTNTTSSAGCFVSQTESGTSSLTTNTANTIVGSITYVVTSTSPSGNTLTLTGNTGAGAANSFTGNWTLTGSTNCTGAGSFTMAKM